LLQSLRLLIASSSLSQNTKCSVNVDFGSPEVGEQMSLIRGQKSVWHGHL
jgi:hypothetical protein